jgi:hypothetical protein
MQRKRMSRLPVFLIAVLAGAVTLVTVTALAQFPDRQEIPTQQMKA